MGECIFFKNISIKHSFAGVEFEEVAATLINLRNVLKTNQLHLRSVVLCVDHHRLVTETEV